MPTAAADRGRCPTCRRPAGVVLGVNGRALRDVRHARGLDVATVAARAGISSADLEDLEVRGAVAGIVELLRVLQVLGVAEHLPRFLVAIEQATARAPAASSVRA